MTAERVRITEIDVGANIDHNETDENVSKLDASDQVTGSALGFDAEDFGDLYADDAGGALFLTRPKDCGSADLLCGTEPKPTSPCFDLFLVRFSSSRLRTAAVTRPSIRISTSPSKAA